MTSREKREWKKFYKDLDDISDAATNALWQALSLDLTKRQTEEVQQRLYTIMGKVGNLGRFVEPF